MKKKNIQMYSTKIPQIQTWFGLWLDLELKLSLEWKGKKWVVACISGVSTKPNNNNIIHSGMKLKVVVWSYEGFHCIHN